MQKIIMKKYKIKQYINYLGDIRYGIYKRFFLVFFYRSISFPTKELAIELCNKLNEKL